MMILKSLGNCAMCVNSKKVSMSELEFSTKNSIHYLISAVKSIVGIKGFQKINNEK